MLKIGLISGLCLVACAAFAALAQEGNNKCCTNNFSLCSGCVDTGGQSTQGLEIFAQIGTNQIQICYVSGPPSTCTLDRGKVVCYVDNVGNTNVYTASENANCGDLLGVAKLSFSIPQCTQGDPNTVCGVIALW